jgi:predicted DNA-binding transcriptional regulator
VARGWVGGIVAFAPPTRLLGRAQQVGSSLVRKLGRTAKSISSFRKRT